MSQDRQLHWETVYRTKSDEQVSWSEPDPSISLALIDAAGCRPDHAVIDIGGGASRLVDRLVERKQAHVAVLDLSAAALARAKGRQPANTGVDWIVADVTSWQAGRQYDIWHDRAVFHFMTTEQDRAGYVAAMSAALPSGAAAIFGTFALDGPEKCSGLPVMRYDGARLAAALGDRFSLVHERRHDHVTPWGAVQHFHFSTFLRI